jgi:hypothetical protein
VSGGPMLKPIFRGRRMDLALGRRHLGSQEHRGL